MFNILVHGNDTAWETDQLMRMDLGRFKESSDSEHESIAVDRPETLRGLESVPTLLMYETGCQHAASVRYGFLRNIRRLHQDLVFYFSEEGVLDRTTVLEFATRLGFRNWEACRTHWAIKDGSIPRELLQHLRPSYDVVLSFAGENRAYVVEVAEVLRQHQVRVFYDEFEQVNLWGKNLIEHLDIIYRQSGKYCVIFISKHYAEKPWAIHERRMALDRALREKRDYILPARFDDTQLPGLSSSIAYTQLDDKEPTTLAALILQKLGRVFDTERIASLIAQLDNSSTYRQFEAANRLGELGPIARQAIPALIAAMKREKSELPSGPSIEFLRAVETALSKLGHCDPASFSEIKGEILERERYLEFQESQAHAPDPPDHDL